MRIHARSLPAAVFAGLLLALPGGGCKQVIRETQEFVGAPKGGGTVAVTATVIVVSSVADHEGIEGRGPIVVRLRLLEAGPDPVSMGFSTQESVTGRPPAVANLDYVPARGTLTWGPNDASERTITIAILSDEFFEPTESFSIRLANFGGARISVASIECRIWEGSSPRMFAADVDRISARDGGVQRLVLRAGIAHAKHHYLIAGSLGTMPGFDLAGLHVPLNVDWWFRASLLLTNTPMLRRFRGVFDSEGDALAEIHVDPTVDPAAIGVPLFHAFVVYDSTGTPRLTSNAVPVTIIP